MSITSSSPRCTDKIPEDQVEIRTGIELLLFTLAWCETDATGDRAAFYINERNLVTAPADLQINVQEDLISQATWVNSSV